MLSRGLINWRFDYPKWNFPRPSDNRIESGLYLEQMLIKKKTLLYLATRTCAFKEQTQLFVALLLRVEIICSVQGYFHWLCWLHLSPVLFCFEWVILLGGNSFWIFFFPIDWKLFLIFIFFEQYVIRVNTLPLRIIRSIGMLCLDADLFRFIESEAARSC